MPYTREYERLADALKRVMASGADKQQAQRNLCDALADRKIQIRVTIDRADCDYGGATLPNGNVAVPPHLTPEDLDWVASRPRQQWQVGPNASNPAQRYFSSTSWKPRTITLIELSTADVVDVLVASTSSVTAPPLATTSSLGKDHAPPAPSISVQRASIAAALAALWSGAVPVGMPVERRNDQIREWQRKNGHAVASDRTIRRHLKSAT